MVVIQTPAGKLPLYKTPDSWFVLEVRGARDVPGYIPAEVGKGMSRNTFRREVLGDWSASAGKEVYPEYGDIHEPHEPLPYDPERPLICCWDLPSSTGGTPAFVPTQLSAAGQWCLYAPVVRGRDEVCGVWEFGERCAQHLYEEFADPYGLAVQDLELIHYGDPAGNARPVAGSVAPNARIELRSAYEVLLRGDTVVLGHDASGRALTDIRPGRGWSIMPGEVGLGKRLEAVRGRLTTLLPGGAPSLVVDVAALQIREAFRGGYHYHQRADGQYELDPMKNDASHVMDAVGYGASRLFVARGKRAVDEDTRPRRSGVRAPGRPRR